MNPTLKRLEEIEADGSPGYEPYLNSTDEWLCARLRDALALCDVLEKRLWNRATDAEVDASALARRRLFGEEQDRGE